MLKRLIESIKEAFDFHIYKTAFVCFDTITQEEYKVTVIHYGKSISTWKASDYISRHTDFNPVKVRAY